MRTNTEIENLVSFFLMGKKGLDVLDLIINKYGATYVSYVCGARDANVQHDYFEEIKELCKNYSIPFFDRKEDFQIKTTYTVAISWRWLIKLDENTKLIVFHDSILPRYRGFSPLVNCLINGENKIGVSALFASKEYDKGDIIAQAFTEISYPIKISKAIDMVSYNYQEVANSIMEKITKGLPLLAEAQDESKATYSLWRDEKDYKIDWDNEASYIKRFVDAVGFPFKGAYTFLNGSKIRIFDVEIIEDARIENRDVGKVIFLQDGFPVVVCRKGLLKVINMTEDNDTYSKIKMTKFRSRFE